MTEGLRMTKGGFMIRIFCFAWVLLLQHLVMGRVGLAEGSVPTMTTKTKEWSADGFQKPDRQTLRKKLTAEQYSVTQEDGTERAFRNVYWDNKEPGLYVDLVSGEPLFLSTDKFDSGTGWPSFTKPVSESHVVTREDRKLWMKRVEVRSRLSESHLGHVFDDGPGPTGLRYCVNSAALRFIPADKLTEEGYGAWADHFKVQTAAKIMGEIATLAGGCFWGVEELFRTLPGVTATRVGYTGGQVGPTSYEKVKTGKTGHAEAIEISFDPQKISYEEILKYFFRLHDPTTKNRQGNDIGSQYRSAIFYHGDQQRQVAEAVKEQINKSGKWTQPVVTEIVAASDFYGAEDYHQKYLEKNPDGYTCHFLRD